MIFPGYYLDLSSEMYHGDKDSISRSALMEFKKSPRKYWARHLNPDRPKEESKPSWVFGTAFHTFILEPHLFEKNHMILPEKVLLKDVGRDKYEAFKKASEEAEKGGRQVLSLADYEKLHNMRDSLFANPQAKELIDGGIYESSFFWKDKDSELMVKSRPDILQSNLYVDLKTIDNASSGNFQREMVNFGYHIQAAMVEDAVMNIKGDLLSACINICVEKSYPYSIGIYIIDEEAIKTGRHEYKSLLLDLKQCIHDNTFNDYEVKTITLPNWY